jgi:hypothetical protein
VSGFSVSESSLSCFGSKVESFEMISSLEMDDFLSDVFFSDFDASEILFPEWGEDCFEFCLFFVPEVM